MVVHIADLTSGSRWTGLRALKEKYDNNPLYEDSMMLQDRFGQREVQVFGKSRICIGWKWDDSAGSDENARKDVYFNMSDSGNRIVTLGKTGAGKTWVQRELGNKLHMSGYSVIYLTDIKNEMHTNNFPLQKHFRHFLRKGEKPTGIPTRVYRPKFFDVESENGVPFQFGKREFTIIEFFAIIGMDEAQTERRNCVAKHYESCATLADLRGAIESDDTIQAQTKKSIVRSISLLDENNVIGDETMGDFISEMVAGRSIVFNIKGFRDINKNYWQTYIRVIQRKIVSARETGVLKKKVVIFIDEANKIVPADPKGKNAATQDVLYNVDTTRALGINYAFANQVNENIPETLFKQARYILIPHNTDTDTLMEILKKIAQQYDFHPAFTRDVMAQVRELKKWHGWRPWIVIDRERKSNEVVYVYAPLAWHKEEKS